MIPIIDAKTTAMEEIVRRRDERQTDVTAAVAKIIDTVRRGGDEALLDFCERFDRVRPQALRVTAEEIAQARQNVDEELLAIMEEAAGNIRAFHAGQVRQGFVQAETPGVVMGQRFTPLDKVGVYVPGGTAAYPSTVLMDVIPAKIAGVRQIVMVTPPDKNGGVADVILAAASVAGVTDIYKVGGAQAVAALCFGTESIPRVDKIVGPGNIYVSTAKRMLYGQVDIDMVAGPSDILVLADETAVPGIVAADMLGQAEHDPLAAAVLVTTGAALAAAVQDELQTQLAMLPRRDIAEKSIRDNGKIVLAETLSQAVEIANALAPEHLELCTADPFALLPLVKNAGSIFLGANTPEALGDYFAGPNHTLPTGGTARFYSPLSVDDFVKKSSYLYYSHEALRAVADKVQKFARAEGLEAHARSVQKRMEEA